MSQLTSQTTYVNLSINKLIELAIKNGEGKLSSTGALAVMTGKRTGRSPKDRFIVKDIETADKIQWGDVNQPVEQSVFDRLWDRANIYLSKRPKYVSYLQVGANQQYALQIQVVTELAWHNLFACNLFIRSNNTDKKQPKWIMLNVPGLKTNPKRDKVNSDGTIIINLSQRRVLLIGLLYAGEMKKAMFTVLNYLLPPYDVLPMHCAANSNKFGDVALFFGLSGTGKTTLSADVNRLLIGDDEHGWSRTGIFNFEGGCYAKCIDLTEKQEPMIWKAIRHGAIMENVILRAGNHADYSDASLTQNTRVAYPLEYISLRVRDNVVHSPNSVIFLTCDLYGVLPPVALLTSEQSVYYFLSGYTALIGSTEIGNGKKITPTFSTCFGEPFFPRPPMVYAELLAKRIKETKCQVYLVNTGWMGGAYAEGGIRFSISITRTIVNAILSGKLINHPTENLPGFNLAIPTSVFGVEDRILNPRQAWMDVKAYDTKAVILMKKFQENFARFQVADVIRQSGPMISNRKL
ncbi:phosphoenolpyruvate carboxykinase (ATP) [Coxiella endosymbiont of Amblyomma americanum]|uniref:phosphoenolpyruvate carboxykinase (ATP) n=1 Tax=Coxiella endosymbiont of Amblyomma americanum TaxID=325775 RepID=UPI0005801C25|nr:phosphoenolpyruvate carboxykinase (ATP) [Coxiella endosymbiont of Amblyomma americanum]AJC50676.1 phosphoenolpyruvate carboxykinase (ATP) [Coxiella endosymbiont of Amblyomma americanum]AUJ59000.1 phosphoenolpyruvate carboxykinase (ATP) [Coxiella-like endosymbiont of Amblyomma americanum]